MPTVIRKLPIVIPGAVAANLAPSALEIEIFKDARLSHWWRAADGFGDPGWECRKTGIILMPARSNLPTKISLPAYNNNDVLAFGSGLTNGEMFGGTNNILPVGADFTVIVVGSNSSADNAFLVNNGLANSDPNATYVQMGSSGSTSFRVGSSSAISSTTGQTPLAPFTDPHVAIYSMADSSNSAQIRIDKGEFLYQNNAAANSNTNGQLRIGAGVTSTGAQTGAFDNGHLAELFILNVAAHLPANADLVTKIESYLSNRYGLA
jgi:hypothetical protein